MNIVYTNLLSGELKRATWNFHVFDIATDSYDYFNKRLTAATGLIFYPHCLTFVFHGISFFRKTMQLPVLLSKFSIDKIICIVHHDWHCSLDALIS